MGSTVTRLLEAPRRRSCSRRRHVTLTRRLLVGVGMGVGADALTLVRLLTVAVTSRC